MMCERSSIGAFNISKNIPTAIANGKNTARLPIVPEIFSEFIFFPNNPLRRKPRSGKRIM